MRKLKQKFKYFEEVEENKEAILKATGYNVGRRDALRDKVRNNSLLEREMLEKLIKKEYFKAQASFPKEVVGSYYEERLKLINK